MAAVLAQAASSFTPQDSLRTLLSVEGLVFAAFSITLGFSSPTALGVVSTLSPRLLLAIVAGLLTLMSAGAVVAWIEVFIVGDWPDSLGAVIPVLMILIGALVQPCFAWLVWWTLR
jgi:hypothetical protein